MKPPFGLSFALSAAAALLPLFVAPFAQATTYSYTSTGTTSWSTATWSPSTPVSSLDNVLNFTSASGVAKVTSNNIGSGFQLNRLTLTNQSTNTNPQNLSIAGSSLNFVKDSSNVLPTLALARSNTNGGTITLSAPFTVTDALTITNSAAASTLATTISGAITNTGGMTFDGSGAATITLGAGVISGTGGITYNGSYAVTASGANTYTGVTTFGNGTVSVSSIGNGGVAGNLGKATSVETNLVFDGGTLKYTGANATSNRAFTINAGKTATINTTNNISFAGATGTVTNGALTKTGAGTLTLSGVNTYTGATTVSVGTLALGVANAISSSSNVVLSGGTLQSAFTQTLGTLNLTASSTLDLSSGGIFVFADSSALAVSWTGTLSIVGTFTDLSSVRFGTSATALTAGQLSQITVNGLAAIIDSNGYLTTAIPEPSTYAALAGVLALGAVVWRRARGRTA